MIPSDILIVEDESIVALDMQARLNRLGYRVVGIGDSGEEAIRLAEAWHPDLALMDIRLKGDTDGIETARQLRAKFNIPVIYLTAYADDATLQRAQITEPFGYLIKPFEERELQSTIQMALYKIKMEKKLQEQAERLQKIVSTVPEGVALLDADYRIALANAQAQDFLRILAGATVGDIVERLGEHPLEQLLLRSDDPMWHEIVLTSTSKRVFEAVVKRVSPASAAEWVLVIREVTVEREIQQRAQLQDRLAVVGQLSAGIAHDFNNILSSIILGTDVIQRMEPNLPPKIEDRLNAIARQANRAGDLIRQILDFSRVSVMEMHPFDLIPLVKELSRMLERMLPENIRLELILPADTCLINGDATRILQLLMNLALNSRDAMPNGGVLRLDVAHVSSEAAHLKAVPEQGEWLRIEVADNGSGIHPDVLPHIFEPFFTTKAPDKGTGLGLAQVYGIVQQHGGHISVESQPGQGASFSVYFPALFALSSLEASAADQAVAPAGGHQQTILLVEDNADTRQSLHEILQLLNYRVLTAANGREALAVIEQPGTDVHLILTDLIMPEMGGLDLCRELRHRKNDVKIIILTGYVSTETLAELNELAIASYMNKPVDIEQLSRTIEEVLLK